MRTTATHFCILARSHKKFKGHQTSSPGCGGATGKLREDSELGVESRLKAGG